MPLTKITNNVLADDAVTTGKILDSNVTTGKLATDSVTTVKVLDANITTAKLAADSITFDKLAPRYTAVQSVASTSGATSIDWSTATVFVMASSLTAAIEFDFTGFKSGQVIEIYNLTGAQTITLDSDAATSEAFYKVGGIDYDGTAVNILQITCLDDSANAKFAYVVQAYVSDATV